MSGKKVVFLPATKLLQNPPNPTQQRLSKKRQEKHQEKHQKCSIHKLIIEGKVLLLQEQLNLLQSQFNHANSDYANFAYEDKNEGISFAVHETPLYLAVWLMLPKQRARFNPQEIILPSIESLKQIMALLISHGADINRRNIFPAPGGSSENFPLFRAVFDEDIPVIEYLLAIGGIDVKQCFKQKGEEDVEWSLLYYASCELKNPGLVSLLIKNGAEEKSTADNTLAQCVLAHQSSPLPVYRIIIPLLLRANKKVFKRSPKDYEGIAVAYWKSIIHCNDTELLSACLQTCREQNFQIPEILLYEIALKTEDKTNVVLQHLLAVEKLNPFALHTVTHNNPSLGGTDFFYLLLHVFQGIIESKQVSDFTQVKHFVFECLFFAIQSFPSSSESFLFHSILEQAMAKNNVAMLRIILKFVLPEFSHAVATEITKNYFKFFLLENRFDFLRVLTECSENVPDNTVLAEKANLAFHGKLFSLISSELQALDDLAPSEAAEPPSNPLTIFDFIILLFSHYFQDKNYLFVLKKCLEKKSITELLRQTFSDTGEFFTKDKIILQFNSVVMEVILEKNALTQDEIKSCLAQLNKGLHPVCALMYLPKTDAINSFNEIFPYYNWQQKAYPCEPENSLTLEDFAKNHLEEFSPLMQTYLQEFLQQKMRVSQSGLFENDRRELVKRSKIKEIFSAINTALESHQGNPIVYSLGNTPIIVYRLFTLCESIIHSVNHPKAVYEPIIDIRNYLVDCIPLDLNKIWEVGELLRQASRLEATSREPIVDIGLIRQSPVFAYCLTQLQSPPQYDIARLLSFWIQSIKIMWDNNKKLELALNLDKGTLKSAIYFIYNIGQILRDNKSGLADILYERYGLTDSILLRHQQDFIGARNIIVHEIPTGCTLAKQDFSELPMDKVLSLLQIAKEAFDEGIAYPLEGKVYSEVEINWMPDTDSAQRKFALV